MLDALAPVLVLLAVRLGRPGAATRPHGRAAGLLAAVQLLVGEEVLFGSGIVVALLLLEAGGGAPRGRRPGARRASSALACAALGVFVCSAARCWRSSWLGPLPQTGSPFNVAYFGVDLANYVVPTAQQQIAPPAAAAGR